MAQEADNRRPEDEDITGEQRLTWNVIVSWATQLVTIVIGFVMPRLIDESLGQVSLGIWDFGWAIVSYLTLMNFGLGSNSSYYVATFRAEGNIRRLNEVVSSAHLVQVLIAVGVTCGSLIVFAPLESWLPETVSDHVEEARWMVLFLGLSVAVQMLFDAYRGLLTGVHRWDIHNGINTLHYTLSAVGMVFTLLNGMGLISLAVVYFLSTTLAEVLRCIAAHRYCPEADLKFRLANRADTRMITVYGLKNLISMAGPMAIQQTVAVLITMRLGPTMLAIFARPTALIRHMETFILKFAFVIMPTTSSLQGLGRQDDMKRFAIEMSKVGWALAIPAGVFLYSYGPALIELWMGADYVIVDLMSILAISGALTAANRPAYRILFGLDRHGPVSIKSLIAYIAVLAVGVPYLLMADITLASAAIVYVIGDLIFNLVLVPWELAKVLGMSYWRYLWTVSYRALAIGALSVVLLELVKTAGTDSLVLNIFLGALVHGVFVIAMYWWLVLSEPLKETIKTKLWAAAPFARGA